MPETATLDFDATYAALEAAAAEMSVSALAKKVGMSAPGLQTLLDRGHFSTTNKGRATARQVAAALGQPSEPRGVRTKAEHDAVKLEKDRVDLEKKRLELRTKAGELMEAKHFKALETIYAVTLRKQFEVQRREAVALYGAELGTFLDKHHKRTMAALESALREQL